MGSGRATLTLHCGAQGDACSVLGRKYVMGCMSNNGPGEWSFVRGAMPTVRAWGAGGTLFICPGATMELQNH